MSNKSLIAAAAVMSLTATPVLAAAPAASTLSLAGSARAAKATGKSEKLFEGRGAIVAAVLAAGVVAGGIIAVANNNNNDNNSDSN